VFAAIAIDPVKDDILYPTPTHGQSIKHIPGCSALINAYIGQVVQGPPLPVPWVIDEGPSGTSPSRLARTYTHTHDHEQPDTRPNNDDRPKKTNGQPPGTRPNNDRPETEQTEQRTAQTTQHTARRKTERRPRRNAEPTPENRTRTTQRRRADTASLNRPPFPPIRPRPSVTPPSQHQPLRRQHGVLMGQSPASVGRHVSPPTLKSQDFFG